MTESGFGQWFFLLMIAFAFGLLIMGIAWEEIQKRQYRDNEEIKRRLLGLPKKRRK